MAEQRVMVKAASGRMVSIPVSQLESWKKRQDEIAVDLKAGREPQLTEEEKRQSEELAAKMIAWRNEARRKKELQSENH